MHLSKPRAVITFINASPPLLPYLAFFIISALAIGSFC